MSPEDSRAFAGFLRAQRQRWSQRCLALERRVAAKKARVTSQAMAEWAYERRAGRVPPAVKAMGLDYYDGRG